MAELRWATLAQAPQYRISSDGQLIHRDATAPRKWNLLGRYPMVAFWSNGKFVNRTVHGLVAETFIGPRPAGMQIRHLDGNALNNDVSNLCYGTAKENATDRESHKRTCRGEQGGNSKLSDAGVEELRKSYQSGAYSQYDLALAFGISQAQVNNIVLGKQRQRRAFHLHQRFQQLAERAQG